MVTATTTAAAAAAAVDADGREAATRQRKRHTKSRAGCGNCKLRRVKCDEGKPTCWKCEAYGVECDYRGDAGLQLARGEAAFALARAPPTPPSERILGMRGMPLRLHDSAAEYRLTAEDVALLRRFDERTVRTVGTAGTVEMYRRHIVALCGEHAVLTHVVLTLVLMHDRLTAEAEGEGEPGGAPRTKESFHWYHATGLVKGMLDGPVAEEAKDALWAAVALLSCASVATIEARTAEEAWPLAGPAATDLQWMAMGTGKREVWKLTDPLRAESVWRAALMSVMERREQLEESGRDPRLDALYPYLTRLGDGDESAHSWGDPYHTARSILVRLLGVECNYATIMYFLSWLGHMDPAYQALLLRRDARALLLLSWWYAKLWDYPAWWLQRRARLECVSICLYLERHHGDDAEVQQLLGFPRMVCGLDAAAAAAAAA